MIHSCLIWLLSPLSTRVVGNTSLERYDIHVWFTQTELKIDESSRPLDKHPELEPMSRVWLDCRGHVWIFGSFWNWEVLNLENSAQIKTP